MFYRPNWRQTLIHQLARSSCARLTTLRAVAAGNRRCGARGSIRASRSGSSLRSRAIERQSPGKEFANAATFFGGWRCGRVIGLFGLMSYSCRAGHARSASGWRWGRASRGARLVMRETMTVVGVGIVYRRCRRARRRAVSSSTLLFGLAPTDVRDHRRGDRRDGRGLGAGRLPAGAARVAGRSDGRSQIRLREGTSSTTKGQETKFQGTPNSQLPSSLTHWEFVGSWLLGVPWQLGSWCWSYQQHLRVTHALGQTFL